MQICEPPGGAKGSQSNEDERPTVCFVREGASHCPLGLFSHCGATEICVDLTRRMDNLAEAFKSYEFLSELLSCDAAFKTTEVPDTLQQSIILQGRYFARNGHGR